MPIDKCGLGIARLDDHNVALIVKWIYRSANERDIIWRRVVNARSGIDPTILFPIITRFNKKYSPFNLIGSLLDTNDRVSALSNRRFRMIIGKARMLISGIMIGLVRIF